MTTTPVGPTGFTKVTALAVHPLTGRLYGGDTETDQLLRIDTDTGAATAVGSGLGFDCLEYDPADLAIDLAGQMWVMCFDDVFAPERPAPWFVLLRVDATTGQMVERREIDPSFHPLGVLAMNGRIFLSGYRSGAPSDVLLVHVHGHAGPPLPDLALEGAVSELDFDPASGRILAWILPRVCPIFCVDAYVSVDPVTGRLEVLGWVRFSQDFVAYAEEVLVAPQPIPTLGGGALALLAVVLTASGVALLRRATRRRPR